MQWSELEIVVLGLDCRFSSVFKFGKPSDNDNNVVIVRYRPKTDAAVAVLVLLLYAWCRPVNLTIAHGPVRRRRVGRGRCETTRRRFGPRAAYRLRRLRHELFIGSSLPPPTTQDGRHDESARRGGGTGGRGRVLIILLSLL